LFNSLNVNTFVLLGIEVHHSGDAPSGEDEDHLSRVILFEDVTEFLFSLSSEEARFSLICQFIDFYGGKISGWYFFFPDFPCLYDHPLYANRNYLNVNFLKNL
jgi:hypothetical protein